MLYLLIITFAVFLIFWLGDLYLTLKTVKQVGEHLEINPVIRFILKKRGKLIYIFKPLELIIFSYLLWFLSTEGTISFSILLVFIFAYALLVVNNAHVFYKITKKESNAFKIIFIAITIALLLFIYLNQMLYSDLRITYNALTNSQEEYNQLMEQCKDYNVSSELKNPILKLPELKLQVRTA